MGIRRSAAKWNLRDGGRLLHFRSSSLNRVISIFAISDDHTLLEQAKRFAALAYCLAPKADDCATMDKELWDAFDNSGLAIAPFPKGYGGLCLGEPNHQGDLFAVLRILGGSDLSVARLYEGHVNAVQLVCRYGSPEQIASLAQSAAQGELSAVWGADDAEGLKLVAGRFGRELLGRKILASGAGIVTRPLVTAATEEGQVLCLLNISRDMPADLTGWQAQGMRSTATGSIALSGLQIGSQHLVGSPGDFMRQPQFSGGAWRFCAAHLGAMERLVDLFREHLVTRNRGQDPYQLQRLAQSAAATKTARFWIEEAARRLSTNTNEPMAVVAFANFTRMVTERCALDVIETVQRGVGLTSFIRPHPIERICRDLSTYLRQPVPDLAMSDAARALLTSPLSVGEF